MPIQKPMSLDDLENFYALFSLGDVRLYEEVIVARHLPIKMAQAEHDAAVAKTPPGGWEKLVMEGWKHK